MKFGMQSFIGCRVFKLFENILTVCFRFAVSGHFDACSIRNVETAGRIFFLFPTYLGRSKEIARRVTVNMNLASIRILNI